MNVIKGLVNLLNTECTYEKINEFNKKQVRNKKDGIDIKSCILYKLLYANIDKSKQKVIKYINILNKTSFKRQSYEEKENNISIDFYNHLLSKLIEFYNDMIIIPDIKLYAVDGTYNNDNERNSMMNLGIYDISNMIPVDIGYYGKENKNKEVKCFKEYIQDNMNDFINTIFVCDRAYFSYDLLDFLDSNNLKYIIRVKGNGNNLDPEMPLKKGIAKYDLINKLISKNRIIRCNGSYTKTLYIGKNKKNVKEMTITNTNNCILVTNLLDTNKYSNTTILNYYKKRWDIEVFFKFIKSNFKFQHLNEKNEIQYKKLYVCEIIITYIERIIEYYYYTTQNKKDNNIIKRKKRNGTDVDCTKKINKSNLVDGIFSFLLYDLFYKNINKTYMDNFCENNILIITNEINRTCVRNSKTPFTKWYVKGYSELAKYAKIIDAILNNTVDKLNKNLKMLAKNIKIVK